MCDNAAKVEAFYDMIGYTRPERFGTAALDEEAERSIRVMLAEELEETLYALDRRDDAGFLDGLADLIFVATGAAHKIGANIEPVLSRVCDANLRKEPGVVPKRGLRRDAVKPPGWEEPDPLSIPPEELTSRAAPCAAGMSDEELTRECARRGGLLGVMARAIGVAASKDADYNAAAPRGAYFPFGLTSYAQMLFVKAMRLVSLASSGREPNHEAAEDTAVDMINYAAFYLESREAAAQETGR